MRGPRRFRHSSGVSCCKQGSSGKQEGEGRLCGKSCSGGLTLGRWLEARAYAGAFDTQRRAEEVPVADYVALARSVGGRG